MTIDQQLKYLKLHYISDNYELIAKQAAEKQWTHIRYLTELILAQANQRLDRAIERRIYQARFPQIKTLEQFNWSWPKKINQPQVRNLFRLKWIEDKSNVIFLGGCQGLEKHTLLQHSDMKHVSRDILFCFLQQLRQLIT
jgi:DNA replication protein DnaC